MDSIMNWVIGDILKQVGGIGALIIISVGWFTKQILVPFLKVGTRERYARWLLYIADDVTDDLLIAHPDSEPLAILDDAVNKVMEICKVDKMTATRVTKTNLMKKMATNGGNGG